MRRLNVKRRTWRGKRRACLRRTRTYHWMIRLLSRITTSLKPRVLPVSSSRFSWQAEPGRGQTAIRAQRSRLVRRERRPRRSRASACRTPSGKRSPAARGETTAKASRSQRTRSTGFATVSPTSTASGEASSATSRLLQYSVASPLLVVPLPANHECLFRQEMYRLKLGLDGLYAFRSASQCSTVS